MKQLFFPILAAGLLSCGTVNRVSQNNKDISDSTVISSQVVTSQKKETTSLPQTSGMDSSYTKTTVVKEFFSDEFDFSDPVTAEDLPQQKSRQNEAVVPAVTSRANAADYFPPVTKGPVTNRLRYRETTITEKGAIARSPRKQAGSTSNTGLTKTDSSSSVVKSPKEATKQQSTDYETGSRWKYSLIFLLLTAFSVLCYHKRDTIIRLWHAPKRP